MPSFTHMRVRPCGPFRCARLAVPGVRVRRVGLARGERPTLPPIARCRHAACLALSRPLPQPIPVLSHRAPQRPRQRRSCPHLTVRRRARSNIQLRWLSCVAAAYSQLVGSYNNCISSKVAPRVAARRSAGARTLPSPPPGVVQGQGACPKPSDGAAVSIGPSGSRWRISFDSRGPSTSADVHAVSPAG